MFPPDLRPGLRPLRDVGDHVRGHAGAGHPRDVHLPGHGRGLVPHEPGQSVKDCQKIKVVVSSKSTETPFNDFIGNWYKNTLTIFNLIVMTPILLKALVATPVSVPPEK